MRVPEEVRTDILRRLNLGESVRDIAANHKVKPKSVYNIRFSAIKRGDFKPGKGKKKAKAAPVEVQAESTQETEAAKRPYTKSSHIQKENEQLRFEVQKLTEVVIHMVIYGSLPSNSLASIGL
jgi:reverse gyrase